MRLFFIMLAPLIFFLGTFVLTATSSAFRTMRRHCSRKQLETLINKFFIYRNFLRFFFHTHEFDIIFFAIIWAKNITRFCYAASAFALIYHLGFLSFTGHTFVALWVFPALVLIGALLASLFLVDFIPRYLATRLPTTIITASAPIVSCFLFIYFPFLFLLLKMSQSISHAFFDHISAPQSLLKEKIIEMIQESADDGNLDEDEKKLIESIVTFRDRIVREIMIPRIKIFTLPAETPIDEAAQALFEEGFSRVPIYRDNIDNIIGILMVKDILHCYMKCKNPQEARSLLNMPVETIVKKVLYTPETKKVSLLLKEFRNKQVHFAVVVDEYGGTEGIVTIEDILEEIVGEISDEYDDEEEILFSPQADGGWLVNAHMTINDAEDKLDIIIPQDGDYETIGGYIYHKAGVIPQSGFTIHHDNFELEVLASNDRRITSVRITPVRPTQDNSTDCKLNAT